MKISIFGNTAASHQMSQRLLDCSNVETVYQLGAPNIASSSNRYVKLMPDAAKTDAPESMPGIISSVKSVPADLIIPMTNPYQLWSEFRRSLPAPALLPINEIGLLEWSKIEGKRLLRKLGIPTAGYRELSLDKVIAQFFNFKRPFVMKFDRDWRAGLQTVVVTDENVSEEYDKLIAAESSTRFLECFGDFVDQKFIIEDYIEGTAELSYHALSNAVSWIYLGSARDYKKRYENDRGHNTAGMGSYRIVEDVDSRIHEYADRIFNHFRNRGKPYIGFLYLGIMINKNGDPVVLEINTRPGDPEITAILPGIENNLAELLYNAATNKTLEPLTFNNKCVVSLRIVHKDYSLNPHDNFIEPDLGTMENDMRIGYNECRGLLHSVITASAPSNKEAADNIYNFLKDKNMGDFTYRTDIGYLK